MGGCLGSNAKCLNVCSVCTTIACPLWIASLIALPILAGALGIPYLLKMSQKGCPPLKCNLAEYEYYDSRTATCNVQSTLNKQCEIDIHCRTDLGLICEDRDCRCNPRKQFWNASREKCEDLIKFSEKGCVNDTQCALSLSCNAGKCECQKEKGVKETYWNGTLCVPAIREGRPCTNDSQCLYPMRCNNTCNCEPRTYFNSSESKCVPQSTYGKNCLIDITCITIAGLGCVSSQCKCIRKNQFWNENEKQCVDLLTYANGTCSDNSQCSSNLKCNNGTNQCNCPLRSIERMCDCENSLTIQQYWDGTSCVTALNENRPCTDHHQCLKPMNCSGTIGSQKCQCESMKFYNRTVKDCVPQKIIGEYCETSGNCLDNSALVCNNEKCECADPKWFWHVGSQKCRGEMTFGEGSCESQSQCAPSLHCNRSEICDCYRVSGNESFWNGYSCDKASEEGGGCNENNECLNSLTCNKENNMCQCPINMFYDPDKFECIEKKMYQDGCKKNKYCREDKGLICVNNTKCECKLGEFWYKTGNSCRESLDYGEMGCESNNQCGWGMVCNTATLNNTCNCPKTSLDTMCDCIKVKGNETFFNDVKCEEAKGEGGECYKDYGCLYPMKCNTNGNCACDPGYYFDKDGSVCVEKKSDGGSCTQNHHCIESLNCTGDFCKCPDGKFWFNVTSSCRESLTHLEGPCNAVAKCGETLSCNGTNCFCMKKIGNDTHWDGSQCSPSRNESAVCSRKDDCMLPMVCEKDYCICKGNLSYFVESTSECVPKGLNGSKCVTCHNCREDFGLHCFNNSCQCKEGFFWHPQSQLCRTSLFYNETGCVTTLQCNGTGLSCDAKSVCNCEINKYWDYDAERCVDAIYGDKNCNHTIQCWSGLSCKETRCKCDVGYFDADKKKCFSLNGDLCETNDCKPESGLKCNLDMKECKCEDPYKWYDTEEKCRN